MTGTRLARAAILAAAILLLAVLHFAIGTSTHRLHIDHLILAYLTLVPILAGAIWFGVGGGASTAAFASALYFAHMKLSWPNQPMENANQLGQISVYLLVGVVAGLLVRWQERERATRLQAEANTQREAIIQGLAALNRALGSRDGAAMKHSENVARLSVELGRRCGLAPARIETLRLAALVHDIGKIGITDDVLFKPAGLTEIEVAQMHQHPAIAAAILKGIRGTEPIAEIVLAHHEKLNGTGYPLGLRDEQIPLEAKILSVADVFCALTEPRAYKPAVMSAEQAMQIIRPMAGAELDPLVVELLGGLVLQRSRNVLPEQDDADLQPKPPADEPRNPAPSPAARRGCATVVALLGTTALLSLAGCTSSSSSSSPLPDSSDVSEHRQHSAQEHYDRAGAIPERR